jgi:hypothetical protein
MDFNFRPPSCLARAQWARNEECKMRSKHLERLENKEYVEKILKDVKESPLREIENGM